MSQAIPIPLIRIDGKGYLGHRLAWLYMHGHFPDGLLDHKTRNPSKLPDRGPAKSDAQPKRRKYQPAVEAVPGWRRLAALVDTVSTVLNGFRSVQDSARRSNVETTARESEEVLRRISVKAG
jgi:hypothetical protein